jgi:CHAT domain-containing protein/tetratricopeptide (TPR) repeat protein
LEEASRLAAEASRLEKAGKYHEAMPIAQKVVSLRKEILGEQHPDYANSLNNLAALYSSTGDYAKAETLYHQAMEIVRKALGEQHPAYGVILHNLAALYCSRGEYGKAEPLFCQAMKMRKKVLGDQHSDYAQSLDNLAVLYTSMGEYRKAEPLFRQALEIKKKVLGEQHPEYAQSLNNLASLYYSMGDYAKAEPLCRQALEICKRVFGEQHPHYATSLNNLALLYDSMGEYGKAEPLYRQALEICKQVLGEQHPHYAASLRNLASLYDSTGDYAKAEPLFRRALEIERKVLGEQHPVYAEGLHNLASLYEWIGDYAKAEPLFRRALEIERKVLGEQHPYYANSLQSLGEVYLLMDDYAKAEPLFCRALEIRKKVLGEQHPDYSANLNILGVLYHSMGDYGKAEPLYRQALEIDRKVLGEQNGRYATNLNNLAALYYSMGDYAKAEGLCRQSLDVNLQIADRTLASLPAVRAMSLIRGFMWRQGTGLDLLLSVSRKLPQTGSRDTYEAVWRSRGLVTRTLAERRGSLAGSPEAQAIFSKLREVQRQLAQLTLAVSKPAQRETRRKRLAELSEEKEGLETKLAALSSEYRRVLQVRAAQAGDLMRVLPRDMAVVDIVRVTVSNPPKAGRGSMESEQHYEAFVLRSSGGSAENSPRVPWVHLGLAKPIDEAIGDWREAINGRTGSGPGAHPPEITLRQSIWDKIEPYLAGCSTVVILPDGYLNFLPWAALPGRRPGTRLVEDYALALAESGPQLYHKLTSSQDPGGGSLLLGDVAYDSPPSPTAEQATLLAAAASPTGERSRGPALTKTVHWALLPGTGSEVDAIEGLWKSSSSQPMILRGPHANKAALRRAMPQSRYIHLATHGFFADPKYRSMFGHDVEGEQLFGDADRLVTARHAGVTVRNPLILSGLVLAGANLPPKTDALGLPTGEDGILTAEEISVLDLRQTELVVLSACDTGLGKVAGGEGVMGLTRAFHLAGARNVVASLWKVNDQATAALMRLFYHNLWQRKMPPIEALRQAQLDLYRHPDEIGRLATSRGPDFDSAVKILQTTTAGRTTADPRLWAAFVLSGPGQ